MILEEDRIFGNQLVSQKQSLTQCQNSALFQICDIQQASQSLVPRSLEASSPRTIADTHVKMMSCVTPKSFKQDLHLQVHFGAFDKALIIAKGHSNGAASTTVGS